MWPDWKIQTINNTLEELQRLVGGYIETVTFCSDLVAICNEEGRLMAFPHCCTIAGVDFVGPVIIAGVNGDEFADVPCSLEMFERIWWDENK